MSNIYVKAYIFLFGVLVSCGDKNIFEPVEQPPVSERALIMMERGEPGRAILLLEEEGAGQNDNHEWRSILASAYADDAGLEFIDLAMNVADGEGIHSGENFLMGLWSYLPLPTSENLAKLNRAKELLEEIPVSERIFADDFKLSIFSVCLASLRLKALDLNHDNVLSPDELLNLDEETATNLILDVLATSLAAINLGSQLGEESGDTAEILSEIHALIADQPGGSNAEKIAAYLQSR